MASSIETTPEFVEQIYKTTRKNLEPMRKKLNRPLTLAEKILYGHLDATDGTDFTRGKAFLNLGLIA